MSTAEPINIEPLKEPLKTYQLQRSLQDSIHDNPSCLKHSIIQNLYGNLKSVGNEDDFIREYSNKNDYIQNITERKQAGFKGIFTPTMECLVNDTQVSFEVLNKQLTFVYDQGSHPGRYFKGSINGIFISDAVDTAPKLTNPSQKPVIFETRDIIVPGSYIGFDERFVEKVVFSGFRKVVTEKDNIFECKIVILASVGGSFRWYDLSQNFKNNNNKLIGYTILRDALENAEYKKSNDKNTGFFIGNANSKVILEDTSLKPIVSLCLIVAKILGDFSSALASSPTLVDTYDKTKAEKFIHASGDRLCSFEALRQGANTVKTSPRNEAGVVPFEYTSGTFNPIEIDYVGRVKDIKAEIVKRFDDLLEDVEDFNIDKYKVDGDSIDSTNEDQVNKLKQYVASLSPKIQDAKGVVETYLGTIAGDPKEQYQTLLQEKIALMPQSPTISTVTRTGKRKSLNVQFHLYKLPGQSSVSFYPKVYVYVIIRNTPGGKRKFHQKRIRRTPRKSKGGMNTTDNPLFTPPSKRRKTEYNILSDSESIKKTETSGTSTPSRKMSDTSDSQQIDPILSEQETQSLGSNNEVRTDDSSSEKISGTSTPISRKMSDISDSQEVDPTVPMAFPEDYVPKNKDLFEFENILNEIKNNIIEFAVDQKETSKFKELLDRSDIREFLDRIKKSDEYDELFMEEVEEALEEMKREKDFELYQTTEDQTLINDFKSLSTDPKDDAPTTAGRKRKRKTYRRVRLF